MQCIIKFLYIWLRMGIRLIQIKCSMKHFLLVHFQNEENSCKYVRKYYPQRRILLEIISGRRRKELFLGDVYHRVPIPVDEILPYCGLYI